MISAKLPNLGLLKINTFWDKDYDIIIYVHDVIDKIKLCEWTYVIDFDMWPKFGNSSISIKKVIVTLIL